jgi:hypothetical protein
VEAADRDPFRSGGLNADPNVATARIQFWNAC